MEMNTPDEASGEPRREEIDALAEPAMLEFGTDWCGHCRAAQPLLAAAFSEHPGVRRIRITDGKGRRLGRSFQVKLWPTLIFLRQGKEISRLVRPQSADEIRRALERIEG